LAAYGLFVDPTGADSDLRDVHRSYFASGGVFRVLQGNSDIYGMYGLRNEGDAVAELRKMYLDPLQKGKGYGKRMLRDAIEVASRLGFERITLETNDVLFEAIGLYRSFGFVDASRKQFSRQCDRAMELQIAPTKSV